MQHEIRWPFLDSVTDRGEQNLHCHLMSPFCLCLCDDLQSDLLFKETWACTFWLKSHSRGGWSPGPLLCVRLTLHASTSSCPTANVYLSFCFISFLFPLFYFLSVRVRRWPCRWVRANRCRSSRPQQLKLRHKPRARLCRWCSRSSPTREKSSKSR